MPAMTRFRCWMGRRRLPARAYPVLRLRADVRFAEDSDGATLLHIGTGRLFKLNHTGAAIWRGLAGEQAPAEIMRCLTFQGVNPQDIECAILAFIGQLSALGLITREGF